MPAPPAVEVLDLVKTYGAKRAVDGLSLTAPAGSVTAVLGPNGAGKTTTVEVCEGYRTGDSGTVRVLGLDPRRDRRALSSRVGVMLQAGGAYPAARADELLRHVASLYADPVRPDELLERLGLQAVASTAVRRLSGGQQQRLALAMAVVGRPELLFLDEPTAGLDPQARLATWELVQELRAQGVSIVLTTHAMDEAERLADHVVVVDRGQVVAAGSPTELTRNGSEGLIRFRAVPGLPVDDLARALTTQTTIEEVAPGTYLLHGQVDPQLLASVTSWCAGRGVLVEDLRVEQRSLEDVFLSLTGRELRT
ncbi:MAG: type transport system ATP-binding protein [Frankiales bacterium]|nr:type transport system ATP-binding protein [Frankiales bacterium]